MGRRHRILADSPLGRFAGSKWIFAFGCLFAHQGLADGVLTFSISDEKTNQPTISRVELWRPDKQSRGRETGMNHPQARLRIDRTKQMPVRRTVPAGTGFVLDREVPLELPDGPYQFRLIRGPEYRIISGNFELDRDSLDSHHVTLPRMVDMQAEGWLSGDCLAKSSKNSVPLRMASEDLHVAATFGRVIASPIPRRSANDPIDHEPSWIREDATYDGGLVYYGNVGSISGNGPPTSNLLSLNAEHVRAAIENPFAWQVPVWLATERIDGVYLLGDWLRLDREVNHVTDGPRVKSKLGHDPVFLGRYAETIYRHCLECGFRLPPLAGSGSDPGKTPIGYNRVYVTWPKFSTYLDDDGPEETQVPVSQAQWWRAVWRGHSTVTNGPCLRVSLAGKLPGYTFRSDGEALQLQPQLFLAVRDPVDYLNVIHNGEVKYSARLDEFAKAGGEIPPLTIQESGWVMIRVATLYEGHYRVAFSAPWYIEFSGRPRIKQESVAFFQKWLRDYESKLKNLPKSELAPHIPHIQNARKFWNEKARQAF